VATHLLNTAAIVSLTMREVKEKVGLA